MEPTTTEQKSVRDQNHRSVVNSLLIQIAPTNLSDNQQQQQRESQNPELDPYLSSDSHISSERILFIILEAI